MWDLVMRLQGQLRTAGGLGAMAVIGIDMTAAFALARALGVSAFAVAELLPVVEAAMVRGLNSERDGGPGHGY